MLKDHGLGLLYIDLQASGRAQGLQKVLLALEPLWGT